MARATGELGAQQAALGNMEMGRRLVGVQTKLRVSESGDAHEREADRVAESVMAMPDLQRQAEPTEEEEEPLAASRQVDEEEEEPLAASRQVDEKEEPLAASRQVDEEEETVATKAPGGPAMSGLAESAVSRSRGTGHPLESGTRRFFEPRFGRDLSDVKVHTDPGAARLAGDLGAQAFTVGRDVYFAAGRYQPGAESGRSLLAHELTHTIQQQPGAKLAGPCEHPAPSPTRAARQAQRQGGAAGAAATEAGPIPAEAGTVDEAGSRIVFPTLKLADFKAAGHRGARYTSHTVMRAKNFERGDPNQTAVWDASVPDQVLEDKLKAKLASNFDPTNPAKVYALKHGQSEYHLIGTLAQMVRTAKRPIWDRTGNPRPKDVDHIVELQISGWPGAAWANQAGTNGNMELLDSEANQDSGRRIMGEVGRLVGVARQSYWRRPSDPAGAAPGTDASFWVASRQPSIASIKSRYDLVFSSVAGGLGQAGQPQNHWQWDEVATTTFHLDQMVPPSEGPAGAGTWTLFPDESGGIPKQVRHTSGADRTPAAAVRDWFKPFHIQRLNLVDPGQLSPDAVTDIGTVTLGLPPNPGRLPYNFDLGQPIPVKRLPGLPNAGALESAALSAVWRALTIKGMSPVDISAWTVVPGRGVVARGRLLPTVPLLGDLGIDLVIDGDDLRISKVFDAGELQLPGPIQVTDSSLEIFAGARGVGARGELGLGLEGVGQGRITATADTDGNFAMTGSFTFDPELFDPPSLIEVAYRNGEFSGSGTLTIGENRVRGIRTATITASYEQGQLDASGDAVLDVPGIERGTMTLSYSAEEGFAVGGTFSLSPDVPGIRSGSVSAEVRKRPDAPGYLVSASGTAVPDVPGLDSQVTVSYEDGIFDAEVTAAYERGMLAGSLRFGVTNRPVDDAGTPGEGPTPELRAFGGGSLTLALAPWLAATAAVRLTPEGEVEVTGRIGLPAALEVFPARRFDRNIFTVNIDIPIVGVSVLGQRIGIFATIGGGLDLTAGFGPGQLRDLHLEVTYNPDHEDQTLVSGAAEFFVPADAGLRLFVRGSLGAGIPVVSASAGIEVGGRLGIEGAVRAGVEVSWTPTAGLDLAAEAEIYAEPRFKFDITGFVLVEADLLLSTIELYSQRWRLAEFEYGSGLRLGARFPIHYQEGQPFELSIDDIEFEVPDIEPRPLLSGLIDQIA